MHTITIPARGSPVAKEIVARTARRTINGLSSVRESNRPTPGRRSFASTLGPCSASREAASSEVRPPGRVFSRAWTPTASIPADSTTSRDTRMADV